MSRSLAAPSRPFFSSAGVVGLASADRDYDDRYDDCDDRDDRYDDCGNGVICINGMCYTCLNGAGIFANNNGTCECTDGSACVETRRNDGGYYYYDDRYDD